MTQNVLSVEQSVLSSLNDSLPARMRTNKWQQAHVHTAGRS